MTDARLPDRFLTDYRLLELTDSAWRLLTSALMWSNQQGTDGQIPVSALRVFGAEDKHNLPQELVAQELWIQTEGGFRFIGDWESDWGQSFAADVEAKRAANRLRQKTFRERRGLELESAKEQGLVTRYVGQETTGRQGEEGQAELAKRCSKCGRKTPMWVSDMAEVMCIKCETNERPL